MPINERKLNITCELWGFFHVTIPARRFVMIHEATPPQHIKFATIVDVFQIIFVQSDFFDGDFTQSWMYSIGRTRKSELKWRRYSILHMFFEQLDDRK